MNRIITAVLFVFLICSNTFAGVILITEIKALDVTPPEITIGKIYIEGRKMRMQTDMSGKGDTSTMIFRGDLDLIWIINEGKKSYIEMDKKTMDAMGQQMSLAMKQMEERMAQMPPEQRKMMENMMKGRVPQAHKYAKTTVKKRGKRDKINGYRCRWYDVLRDGRRIREMCVSKLKDIGIKKKTFDVFKDMARFYSGLFESMKSNPMFRMEENPFEEFEKMDGYPILTRKYKGAVIVGETAFKAVEHKRFKKSLFKVPAGYTKESLGGRGMKR